MAIQTANLGTPPSGIGGDTFRTAATKFNENFTNNEHAASRLVGTQAGNVMVVGAFGLGATAGDSTYYNNINVSTIPIGCYVVSPVATGSPGANGEGSLMVLGGGRYQTQIHRQNIQNQLNVRFGNGLNSFSNWGGILISGINTTTDSNGFIKAASPVIKLFANNIELNDEAQQQEIIFEKLGIGEYLIKGSTGFAQQGWYVEAPKDANGNSLVAVVYEQLENQDISVKTYKKKFDIETASIVADLEQAIDIPVGRWIDIRLQELPLPEFVPPVSNTPASFQPTGIAQAVSEMMNGTEQ